MKKYLIVSVFVVVSFTQPFYAFSQLGDNTSVVVQANVVTNDPKQLIKLPEQDLIEWIANALQSLEDANKQLLKEQGKQEVYKQQLDDILEKLKKQVIEEAVNTAYGSKANFKQRTKGVIRDSFIAVVYASFLQSSSLSTVAATQWAHAIASAINLPIPFAYKNPLIGASVATVMWAYLSGNLSPFNLFGAA